MGDRLITIGTFEYVADVQIVKAKLEYEGIPVFLKDETILATDPLISAAIGGVKLQVYASDRERAMEIYDEIRSYARDKEGNLITCPNCKAQRSEAYYSRKKIFHRLFPFLEPVKYRCLNCQMITKPDPQ
ncbi:putative signal transducing protein [Zeaxanthinibacter enoshimensis]|uniref:putative signal transducing protein n=1 Tax=Zeaxanthinibacter enoshimensis TaxID=392009 RepID=UPI0035690540